MPAEDARQELETRTWFASLAALVGLFLGAAGVARADSAVILGAGQTGDWTTTGFVANPNSSLTDLIVAPSPMSSSAAPFPCPDECTSYEITLPALGSTGLSFSLSGFSFGTVYLTQPTPVPPGQAFPVVEASIGEVDNSRSVNIPVVLLSRLISANLSALNFPGVASFPIRFGVTSYSNLVLGNIERDDGIPGEDLPMRLELFDPQGRLLGSASLTLAYGQTLLIPQIAPYVGGPAIGIGYFQLRVTRVSGSALMWGILYTTSNDSSPAPVTASTGANLSP